MKNPKNLTLVNQEFSYLRYEEIEIKQLIPFFLLLDIYTYDPHTYTHSKSPIQFLANLPRYEGVEGILEWMICN